VPNFDLQTIIASVPALLIGFAFHEFAHAYVADRLGDPTPRSQGRLTLNPLVHLDLFGTIMILFYHFGWAKPVQTNPSYFKVGPVKGRMYVSIAGPLMNLVIAFVGFLLGTIVLQFIQDPALSSAMQSIFFWIIWINLSLGVFNLIPIPPLDGFAVLTGLLPDQYARKLWEIERYGMIILVIVLFTGIFGKILTPAVNGLFDLYSSIVHVILGPFLG